jgi:hypothetical protein
MPGEYPILVLGDRTAVSNYSSASSQYTLVTSTSGTTFKKQTTLGGFVLGVLQDTPSSGQAGAVMVYGVSRVRVNNATHIGIVNMDKLKCSTTAGAKPSTTAVANYVWGRALESLTTNSTGVIWALITHQGSGSTTVQGGA